MKLQFINCDGKVVEFDSNTTLEELAKAGITVSLHPKEESKPKDPTIYIHEP